MKVKQASAGALTNFEVLDFLRSRGVSRGSAQLIDPQDKPKLQVYDYLVSSAACNQTRESINEFLKKCEKYDLAKAEKLNIVNIRPSSLVEFQPDVSPKDFEAIVKLLESPPRVSSLQTHFSDQIIDECEKRMTDEVVEELAELVVNVLPPPPTQPGTEDEDIEENPDNVLPPPSTQPGTEDENMEENPDNVLPPPSTQPGTENENMEENSDE